MSKIRLKQTIAATGLSNSLSFPTLVLENVVGAREGEAVAGLVRTL